MSSSRVRTLSSLALASTAVLALPAGTAVAKKSSTTTYPVIKTVSPMKVGVGDLLTIGGRGFRAGKNKNTVVFKRTGQRAIFVKAESATKTVIKLHVPVKLQAYMKVVANAPVPSAFAIRVIAKRFGKKFTGKNLSPLVGPAGSGVAPPGTGGAATAYEACLAKANANPAGDEDTDSLANSLEKSLGLDPCRADTDTDGMTDGWEYQSALDLNSRAVPYPGKKPWPNPLDPSDGGNDFDGDGLPSATEFAIWQYLGAGFNADGTLSVYSDGTQNTGGTVPVTTPEQANLDMDGDGNLTDDERDADNDGLSNIVEVSTQGKLKWWEGAYKLEKPYGWRVFGETSAIDPDSDGDGVLDGADDQDVDGYDNFVEMQLNRARSPWLVNPYNPCLPDAYSRSCGRYVPLDASSAWPPFDPAHSYLVGTAVPFSNLPSPLAPAGPGEVPWNGQGGPQGA
jgi:hypothetical protein